MDLVVRDVFEGDHGALLVLPGMVGSTSKGQSPNQKHHLLELRLFQFMDLYIVALTWKA